MTGSVHNGLLCQGPEVPTTTMGPVVDNVERGVHNTSVTVTSKMCYSFGFDLIFYIDEYKELKYHFSWIDSLYTVLGVLSPIY